MRLYNTLTKKIEKFKPLNPSKVTFYSCGPTVYDYTHIGHLRTFVNNDLLKRTLTFLNFKVNHVMNVTDVGHLTGDNDTGEDKLEKGAKKTGKNVWQVSRYYTNFFLKTLDSANIIKPNILCKASDYISSMIRIIELLEQKGCTYQTKEAVYFDVSKFPKYGKLSGQKLEDKIKGAREEVYVDPNKKNPADFSLWFKKIGRFKNHTMHWNSPWGEGFPGWHIECSAMAMELLGKTIDIHSGGIEHIPVHHENEIAQSESATGKKFVRYWFHNAHLLIDGKKMSKSLNNFYTIQDLQKKRIDPLAIRLLFLQTHYRQKLNFTWQSAKSAQKTYRKLKNYVLQLKKQRARTTLSKEKLKKINIYRDRFAQAISNDLQIPQAVAIMWEMLKSNIPSEDKLDLLFFDFDSVFGLKLSEIEEEKIPQEIINLAQQREKARKDEKFKEGDQLRKEIEKKGYTIEDTPQGWQLKAK